MTALQAREKNFAKPAPKNRRSGIAGWLVIFSIGLVGINVAKQHFRNVKSSANEKVVAQPQELPLTQAQRNGRGGKCRHFGVSLPTSNAKNARATEWETTSCPYLPQGRPPEAQARRREIAAPEKVSASEILHGPSNFWTILGELATLHKKDKDSSLQTRNLPINCRPALEPPIYPGNLANRTCILCIHCTCRLTSYMYQEASTSTYLCSQLTTHKRSHMIVFFMLTPHVSPGTHSEFTLTSIRKASASDMFR